MDKNLNSAGANDWVDDRLAELVSPAGWEPDAGRAFERLRQRSANENEPRAWVPRAWALFAAPAAAVCLAFLAFPSFRGMTGVGGQGGVPPTEPPAESLVAFAEAERRAPAAVFEGETTLLRPENYREWVFVGSSLGLSYAEVPDSAVEPGDDLFHNVYIDPVAYEAYSGTGEFPDGTVMVLELATAEVQNEPGLQGMYEKDFVALEASVKDSSRFEGNWAYFGFTERGGGLKDRAEPFDREFCWNCHNEHAETDMVFTQFYPVLRAGSE